MQSESERHDASTERAAAPAPAPAGSGSGARRRFGDARIIGVGVVLAVVALLGVIDLATSSPALCGSCHEMAPRAATWKKSAHASVKCVKCHTGPHTWYQVPQSVVSQTLLLGRDTFSHVTGRYTDPVDSRRAGAQPVKDAICLQCHDVNRKATSGFRILINHAEHAKRNGSCVSCHVRTAHPLASRGTPLSLMTQCFTCHGAPEKPKALATCSVCHPSGYPLKPTSHKTAQWTRGHAVVAQSDRKQCEMCHAQKFCDDCHGLPMPHPTGWAVGKTGHAASAQKNRQVCAKCHTQKPDLCSMCHHQNYDPRKGNWVRQHFLEVDARGAAGCMKCHSPVYCVRCHVRQPTP